MSSGDESHSKTLLISHCSGLGLAEILTSNQKLNKKKKKLIFSKICSYKNKILYEAGKLNVIAWSRWISYLCAWGHGLVVALMVGLVDLGGLSNFNNSILSSNWWLFWSPIPCTLSNLLAWGFCPAIPILLWQFLRSFTKKIAMFSCKVFSQKTKIKIF